MNVQRDVHIADKEHDSGVLMPYERWITRRLTVKQFHEIFERPGTGAGRILLVRIKTWVRVCSAAAMEEMESPSRGKCFGRR